MPDIQKLKDTASQIRRDIIRMVTGAQSGHPGGSLSSTDIVTALFFSQMKHSPKNWDRSGKGNDMFFLSCGHESPLFYSALARSGYFPVKELGTFRILGSRLQGHPATDTGLPGIYEASGSLGQGLSVAVGAALGKKLEGEKNYVYVLLGDGESEEGQIWEAAEFASHHKVNNLIAITDWNGQQIDGTTTEVIGPDHLDQRWKAFGWNVIVVENGHDFNEILSSFKLAQELESKEEKPVMILMKTIMGKGVDFMEGTCKWHGKAPKPEEAEKALVQLKETLGDY
ncbi:MAG TPA: transketolase [Candidatus Egerieousia sp.]|nr:transketolase [Candidatus Egerieousia sp.]HPT05298.1 transketolase [Candidatus Egerieousia sp.]